MAGIRYILFILLSIVALRFYQIQVIEAPGYARTARGIVWRELSVPPRRGTIYDREGRTLARDTRVYSVAVRPARVRDPSGTARLLAQALDLPEGWVRQRMGENPVFVYVQRMVDPEKVPALQSVAAADPGVVLQAELGRTYPNGPLAGPILGFVGIDRQGLSGFEAYNEKLLCGSLGRMRADVDVNQHPIPYRRSIILPSADGVDVYLTLDSEIQRTCEQVLQDTVAQSSARMGIAIVLGAQTGEILAAASTPPFNPNKPGDTVPHWRESPVTQWAFEPGSTLKSLVVAAALDSGTITEKDRFYCSGSREIAGYTVRCAHAGRGGHGWLRPADILRVSCNVGAMQIGVKMKPERLLPYLKGFGFFSPTNVELAEATGSVPGYRGPVWAATAAFGQGISTTALQLAVAYAALANDGLLLRPRLVAAVSAPNGRGLRPTEPTPIGQVISPEVSRKVCQWLVAVIEEADGTGKAARIPGYTIAGKTGTAQKPKGGHYVPGLYTGSFVGLVPADRPEYVILVIVDEPSAGSYYGGQVAAPAFRKIAEKVLALYPSRPEPVKGGAVAAPAESQPEEKPGEPSIPSLRGTVR